MKNYSYYVYILKCADGSYYTGVTNNLNRRVYEHEEGLDKRAYTYNKRPVRLMYHEEFGHIDEAIESEKKIKRWSRRKKRALIDNDWKRLHEYSKRSTPDKPFRRK